MTSKSEQIQCTKASMIYSDKRNDHVLMTNFHGMTKNRVEDLFRETKILILMHKWRSKANNRANDLSG